jgi:penicillin-binding protein 1A
VFKDFMRMALKDKPDVPFRVPPGIKLIPVDYRSGMRSSGKDAIIEAFKPGTAPPDSYTVIGDPSPKAAAAAAPANADRSVGSGTGGLY